MNQQLSVRPNVHSTKRLLTKYPVHQMSVNKMSIKETSCNAVDSVDSLYGRMIDLTGFYMRWAFKRKERYDMIHD